MRRIVKEGRGGGGSLKGIRLRFHASKICETVFLRRKRYTGKGNLPEWHFQRNMSRMIRWFTWGGGGGGFSSAFNTVQDISRRVVFFVGGGNQCIQLVSRFCTANCRPSVRQLPTFLHKVEGLNPSPPPPPPPLSLWWLFKCFNLFGVLQRCQHCTGHITTGSWKGGGNQYIQFVRVLYCKLPTNGKQLPAFPLEAVPGTEPLALRGGRRECYHSATVAPLKCFNAIYIYHALNLHLLRVEHKTVKSLWNKKTNDLICKQRTGKDWPPVQQYKCRLFAWVTSCSVTVVNCPAWRPTCYIGCV